MFRLSSISLVVVVAATLLLLFVFLSSSSVDAFIGVPSLSHEVRCPACVAFAAALRRASWESHPAFDVRDRKARRKVLHRDERLQDILTEAMDMLLQRIQYVYFKPPLPPGPEYSNALLFSNKSDAPKDASVIFWSLQDLYLHRRLQVAEFRAIRAIQTKNSDESLMHFLHNEIREEMGEQAEALCSLDIFHSSNNTMDEYYVAPSGEGTLEHLSAAGKWLQPPPQQPSKKRQEQQQQQKAISGGSTTPEEDAVATARAIADEFWLQLNILKDPVADANGMMVWASKLCDGSGMCGDDARKKGKDVKAYMRELLPVMPPYREATSYTSGTGNEQDDAEKPLMNEDF